MLVTGPQSVCGVNCWKVCPQHEMKESPRTRVMQESKKFHNHRMTDVGHHPSLLHPISSTVYTEILHTRGRSRGGGGGGQAVWTPPFGEDSNTNCPEYCPPFFLPLDPPPPPHLLKFLDLPLYTVLSMAKKHYTRNSNSLHPGTTHCDIMHRIIYLSIHIIPFINTKMKSPSLPNKD